MAALRIVPIGLAMPLPAMSGAEPWIGSYRPAVGLKSGEVASATEGAPAREAEGRRPRDPGMTLDSSERLKVATYRSAKEDRPLRLGGTHMSPKRFSVKMTPLSFFGLATINIEAESTKWWSSASCGYSACSVSVTTFRHRRELARTFALSIE